MGAAVNQVGLRPPLIPTFRLGFGSHHAGMTVLMRPGPVLATLFVALSATRAWAVDIDPQDTVHYDRCLAYLTALDAELGTAPASDPRLIGAEMALVDLALCGDVRDRGDDGGIWRHRAHELRDARAAAGAPIGIAARIFADAVPDLWVDALDGNSAACLAGLDHFPASKDDPQAVALRCYASGDWRAVRNREDLGPHGQIALAHAYVRSGSVDLIAAMDHSSMPALTWADFSRAAGDSEESSAASLREAVVRASFLAVAPDLPASAATAAAAVAALIPVDGSGAASAPTVGKLRYAMIANGTWGQGATVLALWHLADAACAGPTGLRDQDGTWHLGAVGDRAAQSRLELCLGMWHRHDFLRQGDANASAALMTGIADEHGWFGAYHAMMEAQWQDPSWVGAFADGIDAELKHGPGAIPPVRLIGMVFEVSCRLPVYGERADNQIARLADGHAKAEATAGWVEIGQILEKTDPGLLALATGGLAAAAAADPGNAEGKRLSMLASQPPTAASATTPRAATLAVVAAKGPDANF